jgi:pSer/pThr/pTyr-binding forkhead associated (FHA) protein
MARFLLKFGTRELALLPGRWRIGRDPSCEIRLEDDLVSRTHATLIVEEDRVRVRDHGSRNGVLVDGKRVAGVVDLPPGARIRIGVEDFRLIRSTPEDADSIPPPTRQMPKVPPHAPGFDKLSPREKEVLDLLAQGYAQREVGEQLGVSIKTVETYCARLRTKLGLKSRTDLVRYALQAGLLRPE